LSHSIATIFGPPDQIILLIAVHLLIAIAIRFIVRRRPSARTRAVPAPAVQRPSACAEVARPIGPRWRTLWALEGRGSCGEVLGRWNMEDIYIQKVERRNDA
jgi:hypothetical protein